MKLIGVQKAPSIQCKTKVRAVQAGLSQLHLPSQVPTSLKKVISINFLSNSLLIVPVQTTITMGVKVVTPPVHSNTQTNTR